MANRKLPFGYCMESGQICVVDDEAEIIRMIFTSYAEGNSYETLAEWLNNGRYPYAPGKRWNKNTLARILQDERYLGNSVYPAILASGAFQRRKPTASGKLNHPQIKDIRILARCAACGKPIQRERTDTWRCPHCMTLAINSTDKRLMDSVAELLQGLCQRPDAVVSLTAADMESENVLSAKNSFTQELENEEFDESAARAKAISLAAARFDALGSEDYETMRIQYILARTEQNGGLDTALLCQITSAILILPTGEVSLKLKNGQIMKRSDLT